MNFKRKLAIITIIATLLTTLMAIPAGAIAQTTAPPAEDKLIKDDVGSISGHVYETDDIPIEGAEISVYDFTIPGVEHLGSVSTAPDGSYTLGDLPTGEYVVQVDADGYARPRELGTGVPDEGTVRGVVDAHDACGHVLACDTLEHRLQHVAMV